MNKVFGVLLLAGILTESLLSSCTSDLKKIKTVPEPIGNQFVDRMTGVQIIYSDHAKVVLKICAPVLLHYKTKKPYYIMPHGVDLVFFDEQLNESSTVRADYAIRQEQAKTLVFRKNVRARNAKGDTFQSDELIWDESQKKFYSHKPVILTLAHGAIIRGLSFTTNEQFDPYEIIQSTAIFTMDDLSHHAPRP